MQYPFADNMIVLTRGNSASIEIVPINAETGDPITLSSDDTVLFTVKNRYDETVIQKMMTGPDQSGDGSTSIICDIDPDDTIDLPTGEYKYDCLLVTGDGQAITFISSVFIINNAIGVYTDISGGS